MASCGAIEDGEQVREISLVDFFGSEDDICVLSCRLRYLKYRWALNFLGVGHIC